MDYNAQSKNEKKLLRPFKAYSGENDFCFISYSHKDSTFVYNVINRLYIGGYNIWYDEAIPIGVTLSESIQQHIESCYLFILFLSSASAHSPYVRQEINLAVKFNKPILIVYIGTEKSSETIEIENQLAACSSSCESDQIESVLADSCRDEEEREKYVWEEIETMPRLFWSNNEFDFLIEDDYISLIAYNGSKEHVVIPEESPDGRPLKMILENAFVNSRSTLCGVRIPNTVEFIGDGAFSRCELLEDVNLPRALKYIGKEAFAGTSISKSNTVFPESLQFIGANAFTACSMPDKIILPSTLEEVGEDAFAMSFGLTEVVFLKSKTSIGHGAFMMCPTLRKISIPSTVEVIDENVFTCTANVVIECTQESAAHRYAVDNGIKYTIVSELINPSPDTHTDDPKLLLDANCFYAEDDKLALEFEPQIASFIERDRDKYAYVCCGALFSEEIRQFLERLFNDGYNVVRCKGASSLDTKEIDSILEHCVTMMVICNRESLYLPTVEFEISAAQKKGIKIIALVIDGSIDEWEKKYDFLKGQFNLHYNDVEASEFYRKVTEYLQSLGCIGAKRVITYGESDFDFSDCNGGVKLIKYNGKSENVFIPQTFWDKPVVEIGSEAFTKCEFLKSVCLPDSIITIGEDAFNDCHNLSGISFPDTIRTIEGGAFRRCYKLQEIKLPDSLIRLGGGAFSTCTSLKSVTLSNNLNLIDVATFACCSSLQEIEIPRSVKKIGEVAFSECTELKKAYIPHTVLSIHTEDKWSAFADCPKLSIYAPEGSAAHKYALATNIEFCSYGAPVSDDMLSEKATVTDWLFEQEERIRNGDAGRRTGGFFDLSSEDATPEEALLLGMLGAVFNKISDQAESPDQAAQIQFDILSGIINSVMDTNHSSDEGALNDGMAMDAKVMPNTNTSKSEPSNLSEKNHKNSNSVKKNSKKHKKWILFALLMVILGVCAILYITHDDLAFIWDQIINFQ